MSTFESSSSSSKAPVAAGFATRAPVTQRKTLNHHALRIQPTPSYRAMSYFEALKSDEEEESIRDALRYANDEYYPQQNEKTDDESSNTVNITIQCGVWDTIRNAFKSATKSNDAIRSRAVFSAITIFMMFFLLVGFGGLVAASSRSSLSSRFVTPPSGHPMRVAVPVWTPAFAEARGIPASPVAPQVYGRAARAASMTQRPVERKDVAAPTPAVRAPSANVEVDYVSPRGTVSAKFLLMYLDSQRANSKRDLPHAENLGELFGFAK